MRAFLPRALLALLACFSVAGAAAEGTTVYVNRIVLQGPGDVSLGNLIRVAGELPGDAQEALARSVAVASDRALYVPIASYRAQIESLFGTDVIIVGSRSLVIPSSAILEGEAYLLDRLVDYMQSQGALGSDMVELAMLQNTVRGTPPQEGTPRFQVQKSTGGGATEITFSLMSTGGGSAVGRVAIATPGGQAAVGDSVRSGTPVSVFFRKGLITIEMPGKTTGSAGVGDRVGVYVTDSQKSWSGVLLDGKAVQVDLP